MFTLPKRIRAMALSAMLTCPALAPATIVEMQTNMGNIDIQLFDTITPKTVANFLSYVNSGAYDNSLIQRSVPGFIIQGGGYTWDNTNGVKTITTLAPVKNEYHKPNVAGTIAMAKQNNKPNSATDQWFFNLANNSANLNHQNGGFTVFGQVIGNGMQVVNAIAALSVVDACTSGSSCVFANLPLISTTGGYSDKTLVIVSAIQIISQNLIDERNVTLNSETTTFTPTAISKVQGIMLSNPQSSAVTMTLQKNGTTVLVATAQAGSTLNIPLPSGLPVSSSDYLQISLPAGPDYANNPLSLTFDLL